MNVAQHANLLDALGRTAVFGALDPNVRAALLPQFSLLNLVGGETLYRRGDPSDALYVLCSGSLGGFGPSMATGDEHLLGLIAPGETVGELGLLTDHARRATVRALRDSTLLKLPRGKVLDGLLRTYPDALIGAFRHLLERLLRREMGEAFAPPRTFALLPFDTGVPVLASARALRQALGAFGTVLQIDAALGRNRDPDWHSAREREHRFLIYVADGGDASWRSICLRQADQLLLLADIDAAPGTWPDPIAQSGADVLHRVRRLLLLDARESSRLGQAGRWLAQFQDPIALHRLQHATDYGRLARHLAHRATGLVLSGGGARGFAHIGVLRALRELGRDVDVVGGTSMGAIIGAGLACGWDDRELVENLRDTFVREHPLRDLTVPLVALTRGAKTTQLLRKAFGEREIEDLRLPYFCVSTNLTHGSVAVHTRGRLWKWLRAGAAIPGILPPLLDAGVVHVDGAVMNNLPTDVMRDRGIHEVIAVDISAADLLQASFEDAALPRLPRLVWQWLHGQQWPSLFSILARAAMINSETASRNRRALATHLLQPPHGDIGLLDWKSHERAIEGGYRYTMEYFENRQMRT